MACPTVTLPLPESTAGARGLAGTVLFVGAASDDREMYANYCRHQGLALWRARPLRKRMAARWRRQYPLSSLT